MRQLKCVKCSNFKMKRNLFTKKKKRINFLPITHLVPLDHLVKKTSYKPLQKLTSDPCLPYKGEINHKRIKRDSLTIKLEISVILAEICEVSYLRIGKDDYPMPPLSNLFLDTDS